MNGWVLYLVMVGLTAGVGLALVLYHFWIWVPFYRMRQSNDSIRKREQDTVYKETLHWIQTSIQSQTYHKERIGMGSAIGFVLTKRETEVVEILSKYSHPPTQEERSIISHAGKILDVCLPQGVLWEHYATDAPKEKAALAEFSAKIFFKDGLRCFVQASTTAIYLGQRLGALPLRDVLFYTNSFVFPLTVLGENTSHSVYPFAGPINDQQCGAWLFRIDDLTTAEELRKLFSRSNDPLTTAFLMPAFLGIGEGMLYRRAEAALMARLLIEQAKHVIILVPANRVARQRATQISQYHLAWSWDLSFVGKKVDCVVSGNVDSNEMNEMATKFETLGLTLHWQDPILQVRHVSGIEMVT